jgi:hypothetical protein
MDPNPSLAISPDTDRPVTARAENARSSDMPVDTDHEEAAISLDLARMRRLTGRLESNVRVRDESETFGNLVGSADLRDVPLHRWFTYKEGFSPNLLDAVITDAQLTGPLHVIDVFGGVGTTACAGLTHPAVREVRSVEYSPLAQFIGATKISWKHLDPARLRKQLARVLAYSHQRPVEIPALSTFGNPEVFAPARIRSLLAAREYLKELHFTKDLERSFFLLGLAAVCEDLSGAMRDGRALRIKRGRKRRPSSLANNDPGFRVAGAVKRALAGQWTAMITDLEQLADVRTTALACEASHLLGDARELEAIRLATGQPAFPDDWADLSLFSPPYLNCIDYTELYKLELWLLGLISSQDEFRETRRGTLRSHPSVRFTDSQEFVGKDGQAMRLAAGLASWMEQHARRPRDGVVVRQYFEDMLLVLKEQTRVLRPGGVAICVVANSTFSRREKNPEGAWDEAWRLPVASDVIIASLARTAGFSSVEILNARELRPKNIRGGTARESLVVMRL